MPAQAQALMLTSVLATAPSKVLELELEGSRRGASTSTLSKALRLEVQRRRWKWEAVRWRPYVGVLGWWRQGGDGWRWKWNVGCCRLGVVMLS